MTPEIHHALTRPHTLEPEELDELSPFELKEILLALAQGDEPCLDAGRGNPNWVATAPREAFFALGHFALAESRRVWSEPGLGGMPEMAGIAGRFAAWCDTHRDEPGLDVLHAVVGLGAEFGFEPDAWVYELTDGIIGDRYPIPDRMATHGEAVVRQFLVDELCAGVEPPSTLRLFAVEGGSAAMCYLFDSLHTNRLLLRGDKVALMVPAFTPYLEIPRLDRYGFEIVEVRADAVDEHGARTWQFPDAELDKLADPAVKALFVINPSNPPSVMLAPDALDRISAITAHDNPGLIIVTDDVYCTFVGDFRSLLSTVPANVIAVYSFSKYFGATGWRVGVVGVCDDNVVDRLIAEHGPDATAALDERYGTITTDPAGLRFIDRMVADSRQVALNHTAGLSLPQQVQMALFAACALLDTENVYRARTRQIVSTRLANLYIGMGLPLPDDPYRAGYYAELDLLGWARMRWGDDFARWLDATHDPLDAVMDLAADEHIVVLDGGGFESPEWTVRVSLANLSDDAYLLIGAGLADVFTEYLQEFRANGDADADAVASSDPEPPDTPTHSTHSAHRRPEA